MADMKMTSEGLKKLQDELENLKVVQRKEVAQRIKEAREQGDLSENAEYDAAKDEQRDIEARITEIEEILKKLDESSIVDSSDISYDHVNVGCFVRIYDETFDEEIAFNLVGSVEANSLKGKLSNESPLGRALIEAKAKVGDEVTYYTPDEEPINVKVLEITKARED